MKGNNHKLKSLDFFRQITKSDFLVELSEVVADVNYSDEIKKNVLFFHAQLKVCSCVCATQFCHLGSYSAKSLRCFDDIDIHHKCFEQLLDINVRLSMWLVRKCQY